MLRSAALVLVLLATTTAGCLEPEPGRSIPLESIAPQPPPIGFGQALVVSYDLESFHAATPFNGTWNADVGGAALADMGYAPAGHSEYLQGDDVLVRVTPTPDGRFWLNATYGGLRLDALDHEEASKRANEAWAEREPHLLALLAGFQERTSWTPTSQPALTYSFAAKLQPPP